MTSAADCWNCRRTGSAYNALLYSKAGYTYRLCEPCKDKARKWRRSERAARYDVEVKP